MNNVCRKSGVLFTVESVLCCFGVGLGHLKDCTCLLSIFEMKFQEKEKSFPREVSSAFSLYEYV